MQLKPSAREASMSTTRCFAVLSLVLLCCASIAFAQGGASGAIGGVVQDASGAVIATPRLVLPREATGEVVRQTKTDSSGPLQRFHRTGALDPNYVVVASIEKKYLP